MSPRVIDLRKPSPEERLNTGDAHPPTDRPSPPEEKHLTDVPETIEWACPEHEERQRGPYWFLFPGSVATLLIIYGIIAKSFLFIGFVAISFVLLFILMKRKPKEVAFSLTEHGIAIDGALHEYAGIKSFWMFHDAGGYELSLEIKRLFAPFIRIPLQGVEAAVIRAYLLRHVPEQEHQNRATDQIAKMLGF